MELRKTEVRPLVRWEREIYDFLWFGVEAGYRYNYRFNAYDGETRTADPIIENNLKGTGFANLEIFLVPPRRFLKQ
ncbi:MAG: hypothetical protein LPJ89_05910 [Hymenobacteraceae bacterium]|nr:hypothetical protein [Hymenobacteraceae bacterium]MDX5397424.1 hypothetical protein [Hymenobacteraceae bacterium]MDX5443305.1 hypothetical protein [Hymenobacteraceae bacterium]MDX5513502.1 hypothetical protein [Hymenobacteraceae bacterium]